MQRILTLLDGTAAGRANLLAACRVAAAHGATVVAVYPIEVPDILPIDFEMREAATHGWPECDRARIVGEEFGVELRPVVCQAYSTVEAILGAADDEGAEVMIFAAPRGLPGWLRWLGGKGPRLVRESACPVMLVGAGWSPPQPRHPSKFGDRSTAPDRSSPELFFERPELSGS